MDPNTIGERIRQVRKQRGFTQNDLAERLDVSYQQVQKYESGKTDMPLSRLTQIAEALGVPVEELMRREKGFQSSDPQPEYCADKPELFLLSRKEIRLIKLLRKAKDRNMYDHLMEILKSVLKGE